MRKLNQTRTKDAYTDMKLEKPPCAHNLQVTIISPSCCGKEHTSSISMKPQQFASSSSVTKLANITSKNFPKSEEEKMITPMFSNTKMTYTVSFAQLRGGLFLTAITEATWSPILPPLLGSPSPLVQKTFLKDDWLIQWLGEL